MSVLDTCTLFVAVISAAIKQRLHTPALGLGYEMRSLIIALSYTTRSLVDSHSLMPAILHNMSAGLWEA